MVSPEIRNYLEDVRLHLRLDQATEGQVIAELHTYFQEKVAELRQKGLPESAATRAAIDSFGRAREVARQMYEAYGKGSWLDAALVSLPHLIVAVLFASHLWNHLLLAPLAFIAIVCVTLFGWWHSTSNWLYSWIGFSLFPLVIGGFIAYPAFQSAISLLLEGREVSVTQLLALLVVSALLLFFLWVIFKTIIRMVRRDWILASLMLMSLPVLASWLVNIQEQGGLFQLVRNPQPSMHQWDASMATALAVLGATAATFIRVRQRVLKVTAVVTIGSIVATVVASNLLGRDDPFYPPALFLFMLIFLVTPALVEARIGHGKSSEIDVFSHY
ncbi:MAG: hypothetical protein HYX79_03765 [Chloroflexi bacterium]|nr:hypothetical protein [Chloroflexota bacterium]